MTAKKSKKKIRLRIITIATLNNQDLDIVRGGNYSGECGGTIGVCTTSCSQIYDPDTLP